MSRLTTPQLLWNCNQYLKKAKQEGKEEAAIEHLKKGLHGEGVPWEWFEKETFDVPPYIIPSVPYQKAPSKKR